MFMKKKVFDNRQIGGSLAWFIALTVFLGVYNLLCNYIFMI